MRILVGSAGRRVYLVRWFLDALERAGLSGGVYVTDSDPDAAACAVASAAFEMPRYDDPAYEGELLRVVETVRPDIFFSLNDYEIERLAGTLGEAVRSLGVTLLTMAEGAQASVSDKHRMYEALSQVGIATPQTALASDSDEVDRLCRAGDELVIKDRYGSGSSGLQVMKTTEVGDYLRAYAARRGSLSLGSLVVQPRERGQEVGLDVVCALDGSALAGVLARRKVALRGGETSVAETCDPRPYWEVAHQLQSLLSPRGLVDVDVMCDDEGRISVLDINPRFGGGYPFCHAAGADVPMYYVTAAMGATPPAGWGSYEIGVRSSKYVDVVPFAQAGNAA